MSIDLNAVAVLADNPEPGPQTLVLPQMQEDTQRLVDSAPEGKSIALSVEMSPTEVAVGLLIRNLKEVIDALFGLVGKGPEAGQRRDKNIRGNASHMADGAYALCLDHVTIAHARCSSAVEDEKRFIVVQNMLRTLRLALLHVDAQRNCAPGIAVCRLFYQCANGVLDPASTETTRQTSMDAWKNQLGRCMRI